ncbi:MAG: DUF4164 family protein [Beijerinckiaceae bacterium]
MSATPATDSALDAALARLATAVDSLDSAVRRRKAREAASADAGTELALMQEDRARLAEELDSALDRLNRLDAAAAESAQRIDLAIAQVRTVLDDTASGA